LLIVFAWNSYAFAVFHTRHHVGPSFAGSKLLDSVLDHFDAVFADTVTGWINRHQNTHHLYTNSHSDCDVVQLYPYLFIKGMSSPMDRRWYHRFQSFYVPILLGLSQFDRIWAHCRKFENGNPWYIVLYYAVWIVIPWLRNDSSLWINILNYVAVKGLSSVLTAYLFLVSHNMEVNPHSKAIDTVDYDRWIKAQVEESVSWSNRVNVVNYAITMIVGGINLQIEHHMAPALCPMYYLFASEEVRALCRKYGIQYNEEGHFGDAVYEFHRFIHSVSV